MASTTLAATCSKRAWTVSVVSSWNSGIASSTAINLAPSRAFWLRACVNSARLAIVAA
jgi:hypothetical protein